MEKFQSHSDKYPYLVLRAMSGVYVIKHPKNPQISKDQMIQWGKGESVEYNRRTCAVFSASEAVFIELDGSVKNSSEPPSGGIILTH